MSVDASRKPPGAASRPGTVFEAGLHGPGFLAITRDVALTHGDIAAKNVAIWHFDDADENFARRAILGQDSWRNDERPHGWTLISWKN
jgi:hypothetical protein